jgi:hypothetical protein
MRPIRSLCFAFGMASVVVVGLRARADDAGADGGDAGSPPTPNCYDPVERPNPVYVAGGDVPLLTALAKQLALDSTQVAIVQQAQRSCTALSLLNASTKIKGKGVYFDGNGNQTSCLLDAAGVGVDVAFSDSFASTCGVSVNNDVGDFFGPISPQVFVVPAASTQRAISAEAAYLAFGVHNGASTPWVDTDFFWVRDETSGTQQVISTMIGVPANHWWGAKAEGSSVIIPAMEAVSDADAEKAIGTLPTENAQVPAARAKLRILAFQAVGQIAAFWPDSTVDSSDKLNVRDGHYVLWGPLHLFARVVGGQPSANAAPIVSRFTSTNLAPQVLDAVTDAFLVPRCAMRVRRTLEGGPISAYAPDAACGCYFDSRTTGKNSCKACTADADCSASAPKCNYGYCEVK